MALVNGRFRRELAQGVVERGAKRRHQRPRPLLSDASSDTGGLAADIGFDCVELADAVEQVGGELGRLLLVAFEYIAPEMRPAGDLGYPPVHVEAVKPEIGIGLKKELVNPASSRRG